MTMFVFVAIWHVLPGEVDPNDQVALVTRLLYTLGAAVVLSPIAGAIGAAATLYVDDQLTSQQRRVLVLAGAAIACMPGFVTAIGTGTLWILAIPAVFGAGAAMTAIAIYEHMI